MKWIQLAVLVAGAVALWVIAFAALDVAQAISHWVDKGDSAWTAPWVNVINRGPVQ